MSTEAVDETAPPPSQRKPCAMGRHGREEPGRGASTRAACVKTAASYRVNSTQGCRRLGFATASAGGGDGSATAALAVLGDGRVVFGEGAREAVAPLVARGDEVEIARRRGIHRGLDGGKARAGNRAGRQPGAPIRVEWGIG